MKSLILILALAISANASALTKDCDGAVTDMNTKGSKLTAEITQNEVVIKDGELAGTYKFLPKADDVKGKDGKTYLNYDVPNGSDGCTTMLVDANLLKVKGSGWIKLRCRGEGFGDTKYMCSPVKASKK